MMTPQEVSERSFAKASFGGYNMAMVDEFLDQLTVDYSTLYKENATLKAKMKVLADSLEEYRATEKGMRRALLAAQQAADEMVAEAEKHKAELVRSAEEETRSAIVQLRRQTAGEQARLEAAKKATAGFVGQVRQAMEQHQQLLLQMEGEIARESTVGDAVEDIDESLQHLIQEDPVIPEEQVRAQAAAPQEEPESAEASAPESRPEEPVPQSHREQERSAPFEDIPDKRITSDTSTTRRIDFENLQFGANYDLK
ncbi:MAG: DivIVA domain-containing protein [Oscillospiraceae bacterium]|nr:DivIVA domain-containing protein [Oscillospiraceae bacterium]